ncbi:MAG: DUF2760 domain-containing protein [Desulfobacter sp.]|nr:DUF2760 domain-containing protein [Desulfobacter sp.]WDP85957.1 MAG: DUF2760 domain-containing protein [Desulfobacter sp.]
MYKQYRKKSFWIIMSCMVMLALAVGAGVYYGHQWLISTYSSDQGQSFLVDKISGLIFFWDQGGFFQWILPGIILFCLIFGFVFWAVLSVLIANIFNRDEAKSNQPKSNKLLKKDFVDHKIEQERKRRLFLHSLSVLQREGRLLDFFDEDLSVYEDGQIGAAVRSIQEDCKKAIKKYIDLKPVVKGEEGDSITIDDGFDIEAINLVGNVSGHPPFQGIIKHPGWKAGKKEVPKLSDIQDPGIMTPAEIEIQ